MLKCSQGQACRVLSLPVALTEFKGQNDTSIGRYSVLEKSHIVCVSHGAGDFPKSGPHAISQKVAPESQKLLFVTKVAPKKNISLISLFLWSGAKTCKCVSILSL